MRQLKLVKEKMNILNKNIDDITFDDVVEHCKSGYLEGVQLDYKEEYPTKDLGRLFAAFANTRGGTIIVGIKENKTTGKPEKWEGIEQEAKLVERVHQQALSVSPLPSYHVRLTNPENNKVFLLIRISEGDNTPYYVSNDSNIWVRTGNIRNPVDIASPEGQELLFHKKKTAEKARKNYISLANIVFENALKLEDRRRLAQIAEAKRSGNGKENGYYQKVLGSDVEWCTLYCQPYYPKHMIITPKELLQKLGDLRNANDYTEFPTTNATIHTIPGGMYMIRHNYDGWVDCQQLYATGLLFHRFDVLRPPEQQGGRSNIYISHILANYYQLIKVARTLYTICGYQGQIKTKIELNLTRENIQINGLGYNDPFMFDSYKDALLPKYEWDFTIDTASISDREILTTQMADIAREVHWYLGFSEINQSRIADFLIKQGLVFPGETK